jgi:hypothetical protein
VRERALDVAVVDLEDHAERPECGPEGEGIAGLDPAVVDAGELEGAARRLPLPVALASVFGLVRDLAGAIVSS